MTFDNKYVHMAWTNDPSGVGLSAVPANGGTGWQAWTSSETSGPAGVYSAGPAYYDAALNVYPALASDDTSCFRMYSPGSVDMSVTRELIMPLSEGNGNDTGVISLKLGINFRNGEKGAYFYTDNSIVAGFRAMPDPVTGLEQYMGYNIQTGWSNIAIAYQPDSVFTLKMWKIFSPGIGNYNVFKIFREKYENQSDVYNRTLTYSGAGKSGITKVVVYTKGVSSDPLFQNENTICFNSLTGNSAYR